ncbi:Relaxase/Mobilisation nuclease domain-containing protein [Streptomyces sp. 2112.2]|uniref:relaxase/mobilization nuclease domain-containing protein n=1 Tax=Streptomyces sp. 2112.2 TaxID=1881024 RepID=UPI0008961BF9|nr:relaxase/mobilization nuclease domain-containing protein [Streptomyces sp. 2112.2]SEF16365.1 Relaxase/Mobilisation nuclease domain-containing protein [Streptomyces sp. 2112.2]
MMPNITRGDEASDLIRYLFGPGRHNEHTNQRLIAAQDGIVGAGRPYFEGESELRALAQEFDAPWALFGVDVPDGHVWHCSISLPPEDGALSDERWAEVAHRVVDEMEFSATSGKAPCRWIAVHHGQSINGNDHIHLVVNLVRDDGTKASPWRDYSRAQRICGRLERELGLRVVDRSRSVPGIKPGEREAASRRARPEPERHTLARRVRAAATTSENETDFIRELRRSGVIARPRYAPGGRSEVVGYSVALQPVKGDGPVWYGGGRLGRDLTLAQLRQQWPENDPASAVAVWAERGTGARRDRIAAQLRDESAWEAAAQQIADVRGRLAEVPVTDVVRWCQAAHEAAGVLAAWSARMEPDRPGPLARAADVLARSAQRPVEYRSRPLTERPGAMRGAGMVTFFARTGGTSAWGEMLLLQQVRNMMRALHDMHSAREERDQASRLRSEATGDLARLQQARQQMTYSPGALPGMDTYRQPSPGMDRPEERGNQFGR